MITQTYDPLFTPGIASFLKFPPKKVCDKPDPTPSHAEVGNILAGFTPDSPIAHHLGSTISAVCGDIRLPTRLVRQLEGKSIDAFILYDRFIYIHINPTDSAGAALANAKTQKLPRKHGKVIPCGTVFDAYKWRDEFILVRRD